MSSRHGTVGSEQIARYLCAPGFCNTQQADCEAQIAKPPPALRIDSPSATDRTKTLRIVRQRSYVCETAFTQLHAPQTNKLGWATSFRQ